MPLRCTLRRGELRVAIVRSFRLLVAWLLLACITTSIPISAPHAAQLAHQRIQISPRSDEDSSSSPAPAFNPPPAQDVLIHVPALPTPSPSPDPPQENEQPSSSPVSAIELPSADSPSTSDPSVSAVPLPSLTSAPTPSAEPSPSSAVPSPDASESSQPAPSQSAEPVPSESAEPAPSQSAEPAPSQSAEPAPSQSAEPAPSQSAKPAPSQSAVPKPASPSAQAPSQSAEPLPPTPPAQAPSQSAEPIPPTPPVQVPSQSAKPKLAIPIVEAPQSVKPNPIPPTPLSSSAGSKPVAQSAQIFSPSGETKITASSKPVSSKSSEAKPVASSEPQPSFASQSAPVSTTMSDPSVQTPLPQFSPPGNKQKPTESIADTSSPDDDQVGSLAPVGSESKPSTSSVPTPIPSTVAKPTTATSLSPVKDIDSAMTSTKPVSDNVDRGVIPSPTPTPTSADPSPIPWLQEKVGALPKASAGFDVVVFPLLLRLTATVDKKNGVSPGLDSCIRRLAARQTEKRISDWVLVGAREVPDGAVEVEYASTFPKSKKEPLKDFAAYARTSLSRDIEDSCNIRGVFVAKVRAPKIVSGDTIADAVRPGGMDTRIALAATLGGIAVLAVVVGIAALMYAQWRSRGGTGASSMYSSEFSDSGYPAPVARGLRFSASRDDSRPSPYAPIYEIPVSDEGETVNSATYTGGSDDDYDDSIYGDSSSDGGDGAPASHSLQGFTGAWGSLAAREVSEPGDEVDADEYTYGGPGPFMAPPHTSFSISEGSDLEEALQAMAPTIPPAVAAPPPTAQMNAHPHDYLIGYGPTTSGMPHPNNDYIASTSSLTANGERKR